MTKLCSKHPSPEIQVQSHLFHTFLCQSSNKIFYFPNTLHHCFWNITLCRNCCTFFIYFNCVLHRRALITQGITLSHINIYCNKIFKTTLDIQTLLRHIQSLLPMLPFQCWHPLLCPPFLWNQIFFSNWLKQLVITVGVATFQEADRKCIAPNTDNLKFMMFTAPGLILMRCRVLPSIRFRKWCFRIFMTPLSIGCTTNVMSGGKNST